ncbi:MAG TPA: efflux RND transporter periplasmic adaptor subunit [Polyangia bacterium]|jgi:RND family efflux transporter MFP subunit|nr:efflux RND transporter periplasmic adaptor subunit [Polyangia bacterium]
MPVQIEAVKSVPIRDASEYVAVVRSRQSVQVQPQVEGHVDKILVASGDKVRPGTPLLVIDPSQQAATVNSQRAIRDANVAARDLARQQFGRVKRLFQGGAATRQDFDQAQTALRQAEASAASSEAQMQAQTVQLGRYRVVAAIEGTVGDIPVRIGDLVTPQTLLTTLDDNDALEAYVSVPLERAAGLKLDAPVEIIDAQGKVIAPSTVSFVSPRADPATQMVLVKARIDNRDGRLRSGQFTRARIIWSRRDGPAVPVLAVQRRAGQPFVWVVQEAQGGLAAEQRAVQLGPIQEQQYPVTGGLKPGERIVVSGVQKLRPGARVMQMPPPKAAGGPQGAG